MCFALFAKLLAGAKVSDFILEPSVKKIENTDVFFEQTLYKLSSDENSCSRSSIAGYF